MIVLDTDIFTFFCRNHPRILEQMQRATEEIALTIISRIEPLQGRFDTLLKAGNGIELQRGQQRLTKAERDLAKIPKILLIDGDVAQQFDRLRQDKKLKKIGRGDLLIAAIVLTHRATLVTRNVKDFRHIPGLQIENWAD